QAVEYRALLRAVAQPEAPPLRGLDALERLAFERDAPRAARQQAEQQLQQGALADAIAADHAQHLASHHLARHRAHHVAVAIAAGDAVELQARRGGTHFSEPT